MAAQAEALSYFGRLGGKEFSACLCVGGEQDAALWRPP